MQNFAEQLLHELKEHLPSLEGLPSPDLKAALNRAFRKMDLVSREEFEAQAQVLARTRERLEVLERQVAELEQSRSAENTPDTNDHAIDPGSHGR